MRSLGPKAMGLEDKEKKISLSFSTHEHTLRKEHVCTARRCCLPPGRGSSAETGHIGTPIFKPPDCEKIMSVVEVTQSVAFHGSRSRLVHPKEINPEHSVEGLMLKLKLQYFDHLMQRADAWEVSLVLGKTEGRRRRGDRG